jgi:hypothetical protein
MVGAIQQGVMQSWTSVFDFLLTPTFTEQTAGLLEFFCTTLYVLVSCMKIIFFSLDTLSYTIACILSGILVDKIFKRKFKTLLLSFLSSAVVFLAIWTLSFSNFFSSDQSPILSLPSWFIVIMINLIGFLVGSATPLVYELGVEMTFPVKESYSMGLFTGLLNLFSLLMMLPETYLPSNWTNGMVTIVLIVTTIALVSIKEEYKRAELDPDPDAEHNNIPEIYASHKEL